jgi:predicted dehydrogenase
LFASGYEFDFFQAVRLLTLLHGERHPEASSKPTDAVRFHAHNSLAFPASAIASIEEGNGGPPNMTVTFLGMTGPEGALPAPYTEIAVDREAFGDTSFAEFLDVLLERGPRLRVLGSAGAFVVDELDAQEAQLRAGVSPYDASYGEVPEARWGRLVVGAREQAIRAVPGAYQRFYEGVVAAVTEGAAPPVPPADAVRVIEVIEAAARSAASASVVSLEPAG